jgi:hypothetical protein
MVDISKSLNKTYVEIENGSKINKLRPYLGMSELGHSCARYLWYTFRWCYKGRELDRRTQRLLKRGQREEEVIINELKRIGILCWGDQDEVTMAHGHCKGHRDGVCIGVKEAPKTEHILEIKTMSEKYFKDVQKKGIQISKPTYYAQAQIYMYKFKLTRTLFICVNKNNDGLYIERIKLDKEFAKELEKKAEDIILSVFPPKKTFDSTWYECKFCDARFICHYDQHWEENCRTCFNVQVHGKGLWKCGIYNVTLATDQQKLVCSHYK